MNEITLKQILEEMCLEEATEFENMKDIPHNHFSLRHRRAMRKILSANQPERRGLRSLPPSKRIVIATMLIFLALVTVTASAAAIKGFIRKRHRDNTQLFAVNAENSPGLIEYEYYLPEIPDGYELYEKDTTKYSACKIYINSENRALTFYQNVKKYYDQHFDNEKKPFEEVEINGHYGLYIDYGTEKMEHGDLVWDNGDYILEISGDLSKSELISLAQSAEAPIPLK